MGQSKRVSYQDIKANVLQRIRNNTWPPGTIIPGEILLAQEYGCARATVNRAMRELAADGILDRKRKAGTQVKASPTRQAKFVIPQIRCEIEAMGAKYRYALIKREQPATPDWLGARLGLPAASKVLHLQCVHYADSKPYQYEDRWINLMAVPMAGDADFSAIGPNDWLVNKVPFTDAELTFAANSAPAHIAEILSVPNGAALFTIERTTWLEGVPVTYTKLSFGTGYQMVTLY